MTLFSYRLPASDATNDPTHPLDTFGVVMGYFDGLHLGHQQLIAQATAYFESLQLGRRILSFFPHPKSLSANPKNSGWQEIFDLSLKSQAFQELGKGPIDILSTTKALLDMDPRSFFQKILVEELEVKAICVGADFRFGRNREGDRHALKQLADEHGIHLEVAGFKSSGSVPQEKISTTKIKAWLAEAELEKAALDLGRPYLYRGHAVPGKQLGRQLGAPTINLTSSQTLLLPAGTYLAKVSLAPSAPILTLPAAELFPALVHIGVLPTVSGASGQKTHVEVHLLDQNLPMDHYPPCVTVYFLERLRLEQKFENLDALKKAIEQDIVRARRYFKTD